MSSRAVFAAWANTFSVPRRLFATFAVAEWSTSAPVCDSLHPFQRSTHTHWLNRLSCPFPMAE